MNIIFEKITDNYILKLAEFNDNPENLFLQIKDDSGDEEIDYYRKIKNNKRKTEWLGTRILLKNILGIYTRIYYDNRGNPFLKNNKYISITHSENYVGIIISTNKDVGIDTERISERILRTAHKFISDENLSEIKGKDYLKKIYLHWCAKETLFKIKGGGGYDFINDFVIKPFKLTDCGTLEAEILKNKKGSITLNFQFIDQSEKQLLLVWSG